MSSPRPERAELLAALDKAMRTTSALGVLFGHAVADLAGMNQIDLETSDLLTMAGPVTAGRLAEMTGLTTGAVTGLIDRLERHGLARREPDPADRRRVIVRPLPVPDELMRRVGPAYESMAAAFQAVCERYSDDELALILDFLNCSIAESQKQIAAVRQSPARRRLGPAAIAR